MNEQIVSPDKKIGRIQLYILILFAPIWISFLLKFLSPVPSVSIKEIFLVSFTSFAVVGTASFVHEYSHLMAAKLLKYPCKAYIFKKPHVEFSKDLSKRDFVIIAIAPLVVHLLQVLVLQFIFSDFLIINSAIALILIYGCMSDLYMIYRVLRLYRTSAVLRFKEKGVFEVIPRNAGI